MQFNPSEVFVMVSGGNTTTLRITVSQRDSMVEETKPISFPFSRFLLVPNPLGLQQARGLGKAVLSCQPPTIQI